MRQGNADTVGVFARFSEPFGRSWRGTAGVAW